MKKMMVVLLILAANVFAEELPEYITSCADCHGANGVSKESDVPTIAGASDVFIADTLIAFQEGERIALESKYRDGDLTRPDTDMKKIVEDFTEEQITEISEYFSAQEFVSAKQDFDQALADRGKKIHNTRCKKCHEDGGSSVDDDSGILAGQWTPYLKEAFKLFRSGERHMEDKMKVKIDKLNDDKVEALLNYYASQQ